MRAYDGASDERARWGQCADDEPIWKALKKLPAEEHGKDSTMPIFFEA